MRGLGFTDKNDLAIDGLLACQAKVFPAQPNVGGGAVCSVTKSARTSAEDIAEGGFRFQTDRTFLSNLEQTLVRIEGIAKTPGVDEDALFDFQSQLSILSSGNSSLLSFYTNLVLTLTETVDGTSSDPGIRGELQSCLNHTNATPYICPTE